MDSAMLQRIAVSERPRLLGIAYRLIGSYSDAEDVVQDALIRLHQTRTSEIESPAAYLTTITTRLAIDHLRSARVRRESYVGPWLPEPIAADPSPDAAARAVRRDHLSMGFLLLLETLAPDERAVLVLHDVFAYSHAEIGLILDRSEPACRQLLRRARRHIEDGRARADVDPARHEDVVRRFVAACAGGDFDAFYDSLTADAELVFDGGPDVRTAARRPIWGAARVARFLAFAMARLGEGARVELTTLNGESAVLLHGRIGLVGAVFVEPGTDSRASVIRWVRNPTKLARLGRLGRG